MKRQYKKVYQFRITLDGITPKIWRQIQVPENYSFWDLHVAIQDAMGWQDSHLHQFEILNHETRQREYMGIPDDDFDLDIEVFPGWEYLISDYFSLENPEAIYAYDFGDGWLHSILLEAIQEKEPTTKYPSCIGGERTCPPEDVGGVDGYYSFLKVIGDPMDEEYEEMLVWVGGSYNPEGFDYKKVRFTDSAKRLANLFR
jgi:Plasmid pRiA4b ORF-3-like protein